MCARRRRQLARHVGELPRDGARVASTTSSAAMRNGASRSSRTGSTDRPSRQPRALRTHPTYAVVDGLRPIVGRLGASVARVAIGWALRQRGVTCALSGTGSPERIRESARGADLDVTPAVEELELLIPL